MNKSDFNNWFSSSKVVDNGDKPLLVYHGTISEFSSFKTKPEDFSAWAGRGETILGASFSESRDVAKTFPASVRPDNDAKRRIISAYLNIKNPKRFRSLNHLRNSLLRFIETNYLSLNLLEVKNNVIEYRKKLENDGFDGITFLEGYSFDTYTDKSRVWMAFYPEQIWVVKAQEK